MKKLIVEIADKYADAASMTFIGTNCAGSEGFRKQYQQHDNNVFQVRSKIND